MQNDAPTRLTEVKILTDGLVVDGVARMKGQTALVDEPTRDALLRKGHVAPAPMLRVIGRNRLVGNRVADRGDLVPACSISHAIALHESGMAEFVNAPELGVQLKPREDPTAPPPGHLRLKASKPITLDGRFAIYPGDFFTRPSAKPKTS